MGRLGFSEKLALSQPLHSEWIQYKNGQNIIKRECIKLSHLKLST